MNNDTNDYTFHRSGRLYWLCSEEAMFEEQTRVPRVRDAPWYNLSRNRWYQSEPGGHFSSQSGSEIVQS